MTADESKRRFLTRHEAAVMLGVPVETVDRMIETGLLARWRFRERYVRVEEGDVRSFMDVPRDWLLRC